MKPLTLPTLFFVVTRFSKEGIGGADPHSSLDDAVDRMEEYLKYFQPTRIFRVSFAGGLAIHEVTQLAYAALCLRCEQRNLPIPDPRLVAIPK